MNFTISSLLGRNSSFVFLLFISLLLSVAANAQEFEVPADSPTTKEEFIKTEKEMIAAATWLEATPIGTNMDKRIKVNAWVIAWISNSPTVTVEVRESIIKLFDKNPQLMAVFMAGYTKYCLENNYSKDVLQSNIAGIKSAITCYNLGGDVKKDKLLTKVIEKDKEGKLEEWVKEAIESK